MGSRARPFDVTVIGNIGVDTNVFLQGRDIDWTAEANFTENVDYVGQAGGYASRGYAALGFRTAFAGSVGDDWHGRHIRGVLAGDGIDTSALWIDPAGTARSVNIVYLNGRRKNFYDGRGHMHLQPDIASCAKVLAGCRLAHFNIPNWARQLLPVARRLGCTVACDIQDVVEPDDPYRRDFVAAADYLFFSAADQSDPVALIHSFLQRKPEQIVVCGMGERGCAIGASGTVSIYPPVSSGEPVIDTNGAGDSLATAFLASRVFGGDSLADAILRGQIAARHTCAQRASSSTLITAPQLDRWFSVIKRGPGN